MSADAGVDVGLARAIKVNGYRNVGFLGLAGDRGGAVLGHERAYSPS